VQVVTELANLAVKVSDLGAACAFYRDAGAAVSEPTPWHDGHRADVRLGPLALTLFTRALYEDRVELPDDAFLHVALFVDDLAGSLVGHDVVWGPEVVSGDFGRRRVAFVDAPGGMRLEFMEDLVP
jgi:hypothetical protein